MKIFKLLGITSLVMSVGLFASSPLVISSGPEDKSFTKMADNLVGLIGKDAVGNPKAKI